MSGAGSLRLTLEPRLEPRQCWCCGLFTSHDAGKPSICDRCRRDRPDEVQYLYDLKDAASEARAR